MRRRFHQLILITLLLSIAGAAAQLWLLHTGLDDKGLFVLPHAAVFVGLGIAVAAIILVIVQTKPILPMNDYAAVFSASRLAAFGTMVYAFGLFTNSLSFWTESSAFLFRICCITGIAATGVLVYTSIRRLRRPQYASLTMAIVTVHWMLRLVCRYQEWMKQPQVQWYLYPLLLHVCLMITFFYRAFPEKQSPHFRRYLRFSLVSLLLSCMAFPGSRDSFLYLCTVVYLLSELYSLRLPKRKRREPFV